MLSNLLSLTDFLDSQNIEYKMILHSPRFETKEIEKDLGFAEAQHAREVGWQNDFVSPSFIKINNEKIVMALVPNTRTLCFNSVQNKFGTSEIVYASQEEINNLFVEREIVHPLGINDVVDIFFAEELEQYERVTFSVGYRSSIVHMKYSDFKKLVQPQNKFLLPTTERYRMRVRYVAPDDLRENIENHPRCFLGVSLQTANGSTAKIMSQAEWISRRFKHCGVFVADSIHRLTLQIREKLTEERALNKALRLGRELIEYNSFIFERYKNKCNFEFILASEVQKYSNYAKHYQQLNNLYERDEKFSHSVDYFARNFLGRGESIEEGERQDTCFSISRQYLLEEMAIFTCLAEQDLTTFIYPGDLSIFKEIASRIHSNLPEALEKLNFISLKPILRK